MSDPLIALARHLREQREAIIAKWNELCQSDHELRVVNALTLEAFRNNMPAALEGLCRSLERGPDPAITLGSQKEVGEHGHHRWKQGFDLRELLRDWGNLQRVLVHVFVEYFDERPDMNGEQRAEALDRLAAYMTEATAASVRRFDELRRAEAASLLRDLQALKRESERLAAARSELVREAAHDMRGGLSTIAHASEVLKGSDGNGTVGQVLERSVASLNEMGAAPSRQSASG